MFKIIGTIFEIKKRNLAVIVLYIRTIVFVLKIVIAAYGSSIVFGDNYSKCIERNSSLEDFMKAIIIFTWIITFVFFIVVFSLIVAVPSNSVLGWKQRIW